MSDASRTPAFAEEHDNPLLEAALAYAGCGWAVFPLVPNAKTPVVDGGFYKATTDRKLITAWWQANPKANIGIACDASGLAVVDPDVKKGVDGLAAWAKWREEHPGPTYDTSIALTPSGGQHWYYKGTVRSTTSGLAPGIDTKGVGGYVVAPPSVIDGRTYRWDPDSASDLVGLPETIPAALPAKERKAPATQAATTAGSLAELIAADGHTLSRKGQEYAGPCPWCGGDDRFVVGWSGEGRDGQERYWCRQCQRSGDAVSWLVDRKGLSVSEAKESRGVEVPSEYKKIVPKLGNGPPPPADPDAHPWDAHRRTLATYAGTLPAPTEYLVEGIHEAGVLSVLSGLPGSLKTMLVLFWALCVALGREAHGRRVKQGPVIVIDVDNGDRRMHRRAYALARGMGVVDAPIYTYVFPPIDLAKQSSMDKLERLILRDKAVWCIIDTLTHAAAISDENSAAEFRAPLLNLRRIVDATTCAVTPLHHPAKGGSELRGSSAILGAVDLALVVDRPSREEGLINLRSIKSRGDDVRPTTLEWHPDRDIMGELIGGAFTETTASTPASLDLHRRLLDELHEGGDGGLNQLVKRLKCNRNDLSALLRRTVRDGEVKTKPGPRNGKIYGL